ncbi:MAG: hypothetical protein C0409_07095, partial [Novosphingobium sp.]|nr:hypothetical protein [Novosphingobium sp.]
MYDTVAERWSQDPEMIERFEARIIEQEFGRQERLEAIASQAVEELKLLSDHTDQSQGVNDEQSGQEELDVGEDWQRKFASFAQDVSEPQMQRVWARILAGEIRKPGSFSYRTM